MRRKTVVIVCGLSLMVVAIFALVYLQSLGYHYPCVRCNPFGQIWYTPTPRTWWIYSG